MRVLIAGGGTGGHFYPALAVMEALSKRRPGVKLAYVGTRRGIEARILPSYPWIRFFPIHARGLDRGRLLENLWALTLVFVGVLEAVWVFLRFRPRVVIGMGGYASFPAVIVGVLLGKVLPIRTMIHEQNAVPGLTNRLLSRFVDRVLVSYRSSRRALPSTCRVVVTGNPIRREFLLSKRTEALYTRFGLDPHRKTILVFGGSQGSDALTSAVVQAGAAIARNERVQVLLVTGNRTEAAVIRAAFNRAGAKNVVVHRYIERMGEAFAIADLVVSRAGATTLAEITSCGKPALLVPWDGAAGGHQWANAQELSAAGGCLLAREGKGLDNAFDKLIEQILTGEETFAQMGRTAARFGQRGATLQILREIEAAAGEA
jgi:UDP-N-acetylglucosamine--N-acetylmuramyl-(pentapeptide) pyrophosphoryl-undecaprenol N-acetylglucosamine transferase